MIMSQASIEVERQPVLETSEDVKFEQQRILAQPRRSNRWRVAAVLNAIVLIVNLGLLVWNTVSMFTPSTLNEAVQAPFCK